MQKIEDLEIVERPITNKGEKPRLNRACTPRSLIRALREADPEGIVMFAVALPSGRMIMAGVQGILTDYDGSGSVVVLMDNNVCRKMYESMPHIASA